MTHKCNQIFNCACGSKLWQSLLPKDFNPSCELNDQTEDNATESFIMHAINGGTILTMREGMNENVEAIGIKDGKICAAGSFEDVKKEFSDSVPKVEEIEGAATLIPAFIEPHVHIIPSAVINAGLDLSPFYGQQLRENVFPKDKYNFDWVKKVLTEKADNMTAGEGWILGHNMDPSLFSSGNKVINADKLDGISNSVPIYITNTSGHLAYINNAAIKVIDEHNISVEAENGSKKQKKVSTGKNGVLEELSEMVPVLKVLIETYDYENGKIKLQAKERIKQEFDKLFESAVSHGSTYMLDAALDEKQIEILKAYAKSSKSKVRIGGAYLIDSLDQLNTSIGSLGLPNSGDEDFNLSFLKLIADGSSQGLTGYQYTPYDCNENYEVFAHAEQSDFNEENEDKIKKLAEQNITGLFNYGYPIEFNGLMRIANNYGWPTMTHANGDHAIDRTLSAFKQAGITKNTIDQRRDRIEHCSLLSPSTMAEMEHLGISPSFTIGHVGYWGWNFKNTIIGQQRADQLDLCASAINNHGMRITLHSDYSVTPMGPLRYMEQAITRLMESAPNQNLEVLNPNERLTPFQALKAMTYDAAWQCHADKWVGSLEVGKCADFTILAESPLRYQNRKNMAYPAQGMRDIPVLKTFKGGKQVFVQPQESYLSNISWDNQNKALTFKYTGPKVSPPKGVEAKIWYQLQDENGDALTDKYTEPMNNVYFNRKVEICTESLSKFDSATKFYLVAGVFLQSKKADVIAASALIDKCCGTSEVNDKTSINKLQLMPSSGSISFEVPSDIQKPKNGTCWLFITDVNTNYGWDNGQVAPNLEGDGSTQGTSTDTGIYYCKNLTDELIESPIDLDSLDLELGKTYKVGICLGSNYRIAAYAVTQCVDKPQRINPIGTL
ncbi:amidohydrolase [Pseudoalteromonas sp. McH1-7]|uniref:amidohydrolase n=1 Tax=Pseudoalteromonas sp. McH1-7 TaxID=2745574 RepID=UPI001591603D|nr:amidohydrolase [Pseudoalteromonas sp. McH1-7]NUZ13335.1 amidohydrolase [Pseudoalteromonas sp. McH1-7]